MENWAIKLVNGVNIMTYHYFIKAILRCHTVTNGCCHLISTFIYIISGEVLRSSKIGNLATQIGNLKRNLRETQMNVAQCGTQK